MGDRYLVPDIVEDGDHAAHVRDGEDGVEELPLLAVVVTCSDDTMRTVTNVAVLDNVGILTEGPEQSGTEMKLVGPEPS